MARDGDIAGARAAWGYTLPELAEISGVGLNELEAAERGEPLDSADVAQLATALGGTFDDFRRGRQFWEAPALAFKQAGAKPSWATIRPGLIRAQSAARRYRELCETLNLPDAWLKRTPKLSYVRVTGHPAAHGARLAALVRQTLGLGKTPISSVRRVMADLGIFSCLVAWEDSLQVDAVILKARAEAPMVALNVRARSGKPTAVRIAAAHELCHALFDWQQAAAQALLDGRDTVVEEQEQRANAFAAHFLAPKPEVLRQLRLRAISTPSDVTAQTLRELSIYFGMGVEALASHLVSCGVWPETEIHRHRGLHSPAMSVADTREYVSASEGESAVALELRAAVLDLACEALSRRVISIGRFREVLDLWNDASLLVLLAERGLREQVQAQ